MSLVEDKQKAVRVVAKALPDIRCLRCGNETFLVGLDKAGVGGEAQRDGIFGNSLIVSEKGVEQRFGTDVVSLICDRCGNIERHLLDFLRQMLAGNGNEKLSDD